MTRALHVLALMSLLSHAAADGMVTEIHDGEYDRFYPAAGQ